MTTPNTTEERWTDEAVHASLTLLADQIERVEAERDQLYAQRLGFWRRAQDLGWTQGRIAAASRMNEGGVTQALRRARIAGR